MTATKALMAGVALIALGVVPAGATERGWYIGGEVGANWLDDDTITDSTLTFSPDVEFDVGWTGFATMGYRFSPNWRVEFELGYRDNDGDDALGTSGDVSQFSQMLNIVLDVPVGERFALTLGGGLGANYIEAEFDQAGAPLIGDDDYVFAWQALAGASYALTDNWTAFVTYRYMDFEDSSHANLAVAPGTYTLESENHSATFGLRYAFGAPAMAVPPAPEQPPMVMPETRQYLVFFEFNKSSLTAEAMSVIAEATEAYKAGASVVLVVGHTDTVGSARYNQRLSERRAANVKAEMVRMGVPAGVITTEGRGFSDPLVPTGPGVREPQNRRAVIELR